MSDRRSCDRDARTERAGRLSGSRFAYLRGALVLLELALVRWALEKLGHVNRCELQD